MYVCGIGRDGHGYPMEKVDWVTMAEHNQVAWLSSNISPQDNQELVRLGVFHGKFRLFFRFLISILIDLIFFFLLDLLAIEDSAGKPRTGKRRGEIWVELAFNISNGPFQLICELERMSRGKTIIIKE